MLLYMAYYATKKVHVGVLCTKHGVTSM